MSTVADEAQPLVLTTPGQAKLQARLDFETNVLIALAERIGRRELRASDLSEYARMLASVEELRRVLATAKQPWAVKVANPTIVTVGDEVDVGFADGAVETFTLVDPLEACVDDGRVAVTSPLGVALEGARVGVEVRVDTPAGPYKVRVQHRRRAR
jgi:transcription elongation GreA/GreB family factor